MKDWLLVLLHDMLGGGKANDKSTCTRDFALVALHMIALKGSQTCFQQATRLDGTDWSLGDM